MSGSASKSPAPAAHSPRTGRRATGSRDDVADGTPSPFQEASWVGRTIDERYRIERLLGEGGMGAVFLAEHLKLQKKVALKIILPQFAGDGEIAERFAREAMASAKLDHPHVASALDYGTLPEGGAYLVMQFVRGRSLREAAVERAGDVPFACRVGAQIADALAAAHGAGIVHRDLKPDNVFLEQEPSAPGVGSEERVRVLDFGIARVLGEDARVDASRKPLTRVGTVIGTPGYMAPEQALGEVVDERADLYALGVVLWEILAGRPLFTDEDMTAIVTRQLTIEPTSPRDDLPPELESLLLRLLSRDRQSRPQHAAEVKDALRQISLQGDLTRLSVSNSSGALTMVKDVVARPAVTTGASPAPSTGGIPLALVGLLAAMMLGLGATVLVGVVAWVTTEAPVAVGPAPGPLAPVVASTDPVLIPAGVEPPPVEDAVLVPASGDSAGLGDDFDTLLRSNDRSARAAAAARLLAAPEGGPEIARLAAELEIAERCPQKRTALTAIRELGDARALPLLDRLDDLPRRGCGFLGTGDCWRCIRGDIRRTRTALSGE